MKESNKPVRKENRERVKSNERVRATKRTDNNTRPENRERARNSERPENRKPIPQSEGSARRAEMKTMSKRKRLLIRAAIIAGGVLVVAAVVVVVVGWQYLNGINKKIALSREERTQLNQVLAPPESPEDPYYVLLVGSDSRIPYETTGSRSDTIILVRIDPEIPSATMLSVPRDLAIELDGYGFEKINAAFAYYGPAGIVKAVSDLCEVDIAHYVEVDFQGMTDLVDELGGIDVNVPVDIELWGDFIPEGRQHLNGYNALIMCRSRNFPDGDFQRMKNQRIVLQAIAKEVLSSDLVDMPGLVSELANCVRTDLSSKEAIDLLYKLQGIDTEKNLYMAGVPSHSININGGSYVEIEPDKFYVMKERIKAGLPPEK